MLLTGCKFGAINHKSAGLTLIELLVVVTIIGILLALLLPAVQAAREAGRRMQCSNNVQQLALAALSHESAIGFFPTGGWTRAWLGHPDRGFDKRQPGGWIYNILPFIERRELHDLGASGSSMTIENANAIRIATPLANFNCPTRRPAALYQLCPTYAIQFRLLTGTVAQLARSDYAINGGDYVQWRYDEHSPPDLATGDNPNFGWDDMSKQTGLCYQRSQVKMVDISDGASNTFLIGEKYINRDHYTDGKDLGDNETMYCGDDLDLLRWTGIEGTVGTSTNNNLPRQDNSAIGTGNHVQWFGSAHTGTFNISFCDGAVRAINYSIDGEVYRRLGNRKDSLPIDSSQF
jgi:prepilin-type N-terminal cleavage/methylation domain-containing protein/prepilin-type processing-associated H-X9-DG protein